MTDKVWILTEEHNDYDQHGAYFVAVFKKKPSVEQLVGFFYKKQEGATNHFPDPLAALDFVLHVQKGGGRRGTEDHWYNLEEVEAL